MYHLTSKLILYPRQDRGDILFNLSDICRRLESETEPPERLIRDIYRQIRKLLELGTTYGFQENLWQSYLSFLLAMSENPFSMVCEKVGAVKGSVNLFAENDFQIFMALFHYDFRDLEQRLGIRCFSVITQYHAVVKSESVCNKSVCDKIRVLREALEPVTDPRQFYQVVTDFYRQYGVGDLGLNKAFRVAREGEGIRLVPLTGTGTVTLDDLIGYESQKEQLIANTAAFLQGGKANNVLLYGDAGTGKSTSIKGILNRYYAQGLRMIQVNKDEFRDLPKIMDAIRHRNFRFIILMDDLSFEEFETDYKHLKALIEGGLEAKPENALIYATSNRRHLVRETWQDRPDLMGDDVHHADTLQEKLSLSDRFGVVIGYYKPTRAEYLEIVRQLAEKHPQITLSPEELIQTANRWEMRHGGPSGRTAQQLINLLS